MAEIKYVGLENLQVDTFVKAQLDDTVAKYTAKIERIINNQLALVVHAKAHGSPGENRKYEVHLRAQYPGGVLICDRVHDWQLLPAMLHALQALVRQFQSKFKV